MVVSDAAIHNIMGGIENTGDVRLHNHRRKLKQRFDIVKKLGQGTYGKVQLGINKETGQEVAIKTIRKCKIETEADLIRIRREIQIMSSVRHPNIIHIYEVFENREKMVLVMEYAAGGELYDYLSERKVLAEEEARRIFRQIATAVYYCHKHNICHRDLKLENILLDEVGNAKIADFGLSNVFSYSSLLSTFCGSPLYASPEIVKGTPYHGPEVDCWSLGVLLYTLVYGAMPFDGSNFKRLVKQISQGDYFEPKAPSPASPLISEMLNVNPARRADVSAICNHWWINEGYSEMCLDVAEELASLTPVRLDLLLSLNAPPVNSEKIVVDGDKATANAEMNGAMDRPVRSHSMGSIPPQTGSSTPFTIPEMKESVQEDRKSKIKKKEHSHSKTRRKERSRSRSRKSDNQDSDKSIKNRDEKEKTPAPLVNSGTQIITKTPNEMPSDESAVEEKTPPEKEPVAEEESKPKLIERRKSKVFEVAEKFNAVSEKPAHKTSPPPKKIILPGINVDGARKEFERRTSLVNDTTLPKKQSSTSPSPPEDTFPLASTVALNKLVESAFKNEPPFENVTSVENSEKAVENEPLERVKTATKVINNTVSEGSSKAATLPRRKTSRAEIQLVTPQFPPDSFKTEVEHFVNKPTVNHKTEVVFPVSAPLPPKPLTKQDNQSKEHIIPIQIDADVPRKISSPLPSWSSKSSIPRTSSSSLSRQSTVDSDSGSTISTGEPIRKSPREVIIPIAVEGGGYVTPSENTLTRMSSVNESEDDNRSGSRCFTLRSTKRRQPEQSQTAQLDTTDSLSSDEDDNFQLLTAENLFSTLLSRVRSLTQRLNHDEMRRSSAFPRSLFTQHSSLFDNLPSRRLTETRSFSRPESAPWRRGFSNSQPRRENSIKKRYSIIGEENHLSDAKTTIQAEKQNETSVKEDTQKIKAEKSYEEDSKITIKDSVNQDNAKIEKKFRRDFSIPLDLSAKQNTGKKLSIEEEFDKFFSKYRKPALDKYENSTSSKSATNLKKFTDSSGSCGGESRNESDKLKAKPPRKSRFLRPDFYDTPAEESKYVIKNEKVRAFRERSLSRQREISKNLSSVDSSSSNGMLNDYLRSRTCSLTDAIENVKKRDTYRRTISEDSKFDLSRSSSRSDAESDYKFQNTSNRKSLILQNELENEIRKTKNMNSKLSGLMMALNDNENQYKKKLEKLYNTKSKSEDIKENETINGNFKEDHKEVNGTTEKEEDCSKRSLLEKKFAYFKQLHDSNEIEEKTEKNEEQDNEVLNLKISTSMTSTTSFDNESSSLTTPTEEIDSDAWSVFSDGGESQYQDNINDRIRRRSFYSRFNIYKQKSLSNTQKSKPVAYSRSFSADYKHRSASNTRPT